MGSELTSVTKIEEGTTDGEVTTLEVTVNHTTFPTNPKTFTFSRDSADEELQYDGMEMQKSTAWTFSERELLTMGDAKRVAEEVARERIELGDVLTKRRPDTTVVKS